MTGIPHDLDLPDDGWHPRPGAPDVTESNVTRLTEASRLVTDDIAEQMRIVTLCIVAGWDHNELRRRAGLTVIPDRPFRAPIKVANRGRKMGASIR